MAKAKSKSPAKAPQKSSAKSSAKSAPKAAKQNAKPAAKIAVKSAVKSVAKPAAKSVAKTAAKPASKKTAASAAKTVAPKKPVGFVAAAVEVATNAVAAVLGKSKQTSKASDKKAPNPKTLEGIEKAFSPLDDRVVVQKEEAPTMTAGGLYIPDTATETDKPNRGRVLAVGLGGRDKKGRLRPLDVQLGDLVIFDRFAGSDIKINGEDLTVLREKDIVAIVD